MGRAVRAMWQYWKTITVLRCHYVVVSCQVLFSELLCLGILFLFSKGAFSLFSSVMFFLRSLVFPSVFFVRISDKISWLVQ